MTPIPPLVPFPSDGVIALRPWSTDDTAAMTVACVDAAIRRWTMVPDDYTEDHARGFVTQPENPRLAGTSLEVAVVSASARTKSSERWG